MAYSAKVVYVHNVIGKSDKKFAVQLACEVERNGITELETFMFKCKSENEAYSTMQEYHERLKKTGYFFFFVMQGIPKYKG